MKKSSVNNSSVNNNNVLLLSANSFIKRGQKWATLGELELQFKSGQAKKVSILLLNCKSKEEHKLLLEKIIQEKYNDQIHTNELTEEASLLIQTKQLLDTNMKGEVEEDKKLKYLLLKTFAEQYEACMGNVLPKNFSYMETRLLLS